MVFPFGQVPLPPAAELRLSPHTHVELQPLNFELQEPGFACQTPDQLSRPHLFLQGYGTNELVVLRNIVPEDKASMGHCYMSMGAGVLIFPRPESYEEVAQILADSGYQFQRIGGVQ